MDEFSQSLAALLDETQLFTREEWRGFSAYPSGSSTPGPKQKAGPDRIICG